MEIYTPFKDHRIEHEHVKDDGNHFPFRQAAFKTLHSWTIYSIIEKYFRVEFPPLFGHIRFLLKNDGVEEKKDKKKSKCMCVVSRWCGLLVSYYPKGKNKIRKMMLIFLLASTISCPCQPCTLKCSACHFINLLMESLATYFWTTPPRTLRNTVVQT